MQEPHELQQSGAETRPYEPPRFETIDLACEISAYAPDEGDPLF